MMGRQRRDQGKLFYEFRLDDRIPKTHLLRRIDVFVTAALADLHPENLLSLFGRINFIQPVLLGIRVSEDSNPENYAAINLHFEGADWKLAGIELPKAIVRTLAASLPAK